MSTKRKTRPKTSTDDIRSPEDKKVREGDKSKTESETESEGNDQAMAEDMAKKMDQILSKLQKLDNIETRLNDLCSTVSSIEGKLAYLDEDVKVLKVKVKKTNEKVSELEESIQFNDEDIGDLKKDVKAAQYDIESLRDELLYKEHYSRRENLMFIGISEEKTEPQDISEVAAEDSRQISEDTKDVVYRFMEEKLQIRNPRDRIEFQRVHRLGKIKENGSRPIIARFLRYADREEVLVTARNVLKNTNFSVFEDMPKELYERRKSQLPKFKKAKKKGLPAFFSRKYPDKLYVNGKFIPPNESL